MVREGKPLVSESARDIFVLILACGAGCMDAFSILALGGVFISALTGNTVIMGISIVQGNYVRAVGSGLVFLAFIPGTLLGTYILRSPKWGECWTPQMSKAMAIEAALIITFFLLMWWRGDSDSSSTLAWPIVIGSLAMGLQFSISSRLTVKGAAVMMVTGMLIKLFNGIVFPEPSSEDARTSEQTDKKKTGRGPLSDNVSRFLGLIWVSFFFGVMFSAYLLSVYDLGPILFTLATNVMILAYVGVQSLRS